MPLSFYLHGDALHEYQRGCELLGSFAKCLASLRAVNAVQPDALAFALVQDRDGVAVADADHAAGEVGGEGLTCKQDKSKGRKHGNDGMQARHGVSRTGRTAFILVQSGREGESRARGLEVK